MVYTVAKLAKLSGVSIRTLHWYDEVGLLKPAYHGCNGYRYYEEKELLTLQQILFFRELGFELKQIKKILGKSDFDQLVALSSHRKVLQKELERTRKLIRTIDKTIKHLKGEQKMEDHEAFHGFSKEKQAEYEKELIDRFGEKTKAAIEESKKKVTGWSKTQWEESKGEFEAICKKLTALLEQDSAVDSIEVQEVIRSHYEWLKRFWTPDQESYAGHGRFIIESDLKKPYEAYHQNLPQFISDAIQVFADKELKASH